MQKYRDDSSLCRSCRCRASSCCTKTCRRRCSVGRIADERGQLIKTLTPNHIRRCFNQTRLSLQRASASRSIVSGIKNCHISPGWQSLCLCFLQRRRLSVIKRPHRLNYCLSDSVLFPFLGRICQIILSIYLSIYRIAASIVCSNAWNDTYIFWRAASYIWVNNDSHLSAAKVEAGWRCYTAAVQHHPHRVPLNQLTPTYDALQTDRSIN